jgi:hypothetical protein
VQVACNTEQKGPGIKVVVPKSNISLSLKCGQKATFPNFSMWLRNAGLGGLPGA